MNTPITGSAMELVEGTFGKFATEYLNEGIGAFLQHKWVIREKVLIHPFSLEPNITIHYMLKGSIDCVLQGFGSVRLIEGQAQMFYLPAGIEQDAVLQPGDYLSFQAVFSRELLDVIMGERQYLKTAMSLLAQDMANGKELASAFVTKDMLETIERIKTFRYSGITRAKFIESQFYELLAAYLEGIDQAAMEKTEIDALAMAKIEPVIYYIEKHLSSNPTVKELRRIAGLEEITFRNYFKRYTGHTFRSYMKAYKMNKVKEMLKNTDAGMKDIAFECGFYDAPQLNHQYKEAEGITPAEYRKQARDDQQHNAL